MIEPYKGRVYDPCCGSGGMFVQSEKFVEAHGGQRHDLTVYGQELNPNTWRLCKMNLAIRGIEGNLGPQWGDTFHKDLHPDLKADFILANPPFNISDWGGDQLQDDKRWKYGPPPAGNANFAWVQHMVHHLAPRRHRRLRPGQRLHELQPVRRRRNPQGPRRSRPRGLHDRPARPALLLHPDPRLPLVPHPRPNRQGWPAKPAAAPRPQRPDPLHRRPQARHHGGPHPQELTADDIAQDRHHLPRLASRDRSFVTRPIRPIRTSPASASPPSLDEIRTHGHVLTPGRYVGAEAAEDDGEPFEEKMKRLTAELEAQFAEGAALAQAIKTNLKTLGYAK